VQNKQSFPVLHQGYTYHKSYKRTWHPSAGVWSAFHMQLQNTSRDWDTESRM